MGEQAGFTGPSVIERTCTACHKPYPPTPQYFYRKGKGLQAICKPCAEVIKSKWRRDNRKHVREQGRLWAQRNYDKRRATRARAKAKRYAALIAEARG